MLTFLLVVALVLGALGLATGVLALRTLAGLRASVRVLNRSIGRESLVEVQARHIQLAADAARGVAALRADLDREMASVRTLLEAAQDGRASELRSAAADPNNGGSAAARADALQAVRDEMTQARAEVLEQASAQRASLAAEQSAAQDRIRATLEEVRNVVNASLRRVALVRFDAFDNLSGRLSFCVVLLDGRGNGVALTSLASPTETRLYARPIQAGSSEVALIPEEKQAVKAALAI
jgi:hypothetical protein